MALSSRLWNTHIYQGHPKGAPIDQILKHGLKMFLRARNVVKNHFDLQKQICNFILNFLARWWKIRLSQPE